jgi:tetratricopeptide (TPR) repeat protein
MADIHISRELLRAIARRELPVSVVTRLGLRHLMSLCPHCRDEITAWQKEQGATAAEYTGVLQALPRVLEEQRPRIEADRRRAVKDLRKLLALPPPERLPRIRRARSHFRGAALADFLLRDSWRCIPGNPGEAYHLAELAQAVALQSQGSPAIAEFSALATAHMGNARKAQGELKAADELFIFARYLMTNEGVTDTEVCAEIDWLEGALRKEQRMFTWAEECLKRAVMLFGLVGAERQVVGVLLTLCDMYYHKGDLARAEETVHIALGKLSLRAEPHFYLCARHNLALYTAEAGRYDDALRLLAEDAEADAQYGNDWLSLRRSWLQGKIEAGRGNIELAERLFRETRDGFLARGVGYDAAMVSLDLALLYLKDNRTADVKRIAEEMLPIFEAQDVHREAVSALILFQDAARREALTIASVRKLAAYLRDARTDPSLRFEKAS